MHTPVADGQHPTRVLVVDADRRVRASLERLITVSDGFTCVSTVDNPSDALAALESLPVDAVLIDPRLPDIEIGLAFLQQTHQRWPELILVAMSGTLDLAPASLHNGAMRFVSKTGQPEDLLAALSPELPEGTTNGTRLPGSPFVVDGGATADGAGIV
jgi:DNA-binding NtrC family response regulator